MGTHNVAITYDVDAKIRGSEEGYFRVWKIADEEGSLLAYLAMVLSHHRLAALGAHNSLGGNPHRQVLQLNSGREREIEETGPRHGALESKFKYRTLFLSLTHYKY